MAEDDTDGLSELRLGDAKSTSSSAIHAPPIEVVPGWA
jgi:hypothetical protein